MIEMLYREARFAIRRLLTSPLFTMSVVISLSLSLGVTVAAYTTIESLLWRTPGFEHARDIGIVTKRNPDGRLTWRNVATPAELGALRARVSSIGDVAASSVVTSSLDDGTQTVPFAGEAVSGNYFDVLALKVQEGRGLQEADDQPTAAAVVVLADEIWRHRLGADPGIVGRTVRIGGRPFVVAGIAVAEVNARDRDLYGEAAFTAADGWISLAQEDLTTNLARAADGRDLTVITRISDARDREAFARDVSGLANGLDDSDPIVDRATGARVARRWQLSSIDVIGRNDQTANRVGVAAVVLVGLVLIVAFSNISSLALGRGAASVPVLATKQALGASRLRLVLEQSAEGAILAIVGGAGTLAVAKALLWCFSIDLPLSNFRILALRPTLSGTAWIGLAVCLAVFVGVCCIAPAVQHVRMARPLEQEQAAVPSRWSWRRRLIACQVAISTVFILVAVPVARDIAALAHHDPGLDLSHLAVGVVDLGAVSDRKTDVLSRLDAALSTRAGGNAQIALTAGLPLGAGNLVRRIASVSATETPAMRRAAVAIAATPNIFHVFGVTITRGRSLEPRDTASSVPVAVLSQRAAIQLFGSTDVVGRRLDYADDTSDSDPRALEVVGVASDTDTMDLGDRTYGSVYVPLAQREPSRVILVGRSESNPAALSKMFASALRDVDSRLALDYVSTGAMAMAGPSVLLPIGGWLTGGLALLSITLSIVGLYGVLSQFVAARTREIGLRMALGADPRRVRALIVRQGVVPVSVGLGLGMMLGIGVREIARAILVMPHASVFDPFGSAVAVLALLATGALASAVPAWRASSVDPNAALRTP